MEETTSSISVLRPRYGLSDLALPNRSLMIFVGCRDEVFPCNIYPGCYVLNNGDSYSRLASHVNQAIRRIPMTALMATRVHAILALELKLKL
jgi:hypothetical protein